ncbi:MAG: hypothetical protein K2Z81_18065 [Cyanobacteria bacterium]|nr:hypothetical protein [Cyanobacteriota bacterium]
MDSPSGFSLDAAKVFTHDAQEEGFCKTLGRSFAYSLLQSPTNGAVQIFDKAMKKNYLPEVQLIAPCAKAEFGSANWHAQQLGSAAGMLPWFVGLNKGAGLLVGGNTRVLSTFACSESLAIAPLSREMAKSGLAGLAFGGVFTPSDPLADNFVVERLKAGTTSALTFATLSGSAGVLRHSSAFKSPIASGMASGVPAGIVHAESHSLLHGKGLASGRELTESVYGFVVIGGAFGAGHQYIAARQNARTSHAEQAGAKDQSKGTEIDSGLPKRNNIEAATPRDPLSRDAVESQPAPQAVTRAEAAAVKPPSSTPEANAGPMVEASSAAPTQLTLLGQLGEGAVRPGPTPQAPVEASIVNPVGAKSNPVSRLSPSWEAAGAVPVPPLRSPSAAVHKSDSGVSYTYTSPTGVNIRVTHKNSSFTECSKEYAEPSRPENTVTHEEGNGVNTWKVTRPDGSVLTMKSPGPWEVRTYEGNVWTKDGEGNIECRQPHGTREVEIAKTGEHYLEFQQSPALQSLGRKPDRQPMPHRNGEWTRAEKPLPPADKPVEATKAESKPESEVPDDFDPIRPDESWHTKVRMDGVEVDIENRPDGTEILRYTEPKTGNKVVETREYDAPDHWSVKDALGREITSKTPGPWKVQLLDRTVTRHENGTTVEQRQSTMKVGEKEVNATVTETEPPGNKLPFKTIEFADPKNPGQTVTETHREYAQPTWTAKRADGTTFDAESPGPWSVELTFGRHSKERDGTERIEGEVPEKWDAPDFNNVESVVIRPDGTIVLNYNSFSEYESHTINPDGTTKTTYWDDYEN